MSFLDREITRGDFLKDSAILFGALSLNCVTSDPERKVSPGSEIKVPLDQIVHLSINNFQLEPIESLKITDIYIYSHSPESWVWFTLGFDQPIDPSQTNPIPNHYFYLAKSGSEDSLETKNQWLKSPDFTNELNQSWGRLMLELNNKYPKREFEKRFIKRSTMFVIDRPTTTEPHLLLYTFFDRNKDQDVAITDVIPIKFIFQPMQLT